MLLLFCNSLSKALLTSQYTFLPFFQSCSSRYLAVDGSSLLAPVSLVQQLGHVRYLSAEFTFSEEWRSLSAKSAEANHEIQ